MYMQMPNISREYKYCNYLLLALILLSIFYLTPQCQSVLSFFQIDGLKCFHKEVTGFSCKTCGMTRALQSMTVGNYQSAVEYHPQSPLIITFLIIELVFRLLPILCESVLMPWFDLAQLSSITLLILSCLI